MVGKKVDYTSNVPGSELEARLKTATDDLLEKLRAGKGKMPGIDDPRVARLRAKQQGVELYGVDVSKMEKDAAEGAVAKIELNQTSSDKEN